MRYIIRESIDKKWLPETFNEINVTNQISLPSKFRVKRICFVFAGFPLRLVAKWND